MQNWDIDRTICAIATGPTPATRGAIRVSGPDAIFLCERILASTVEPLAEQKHANRIDAVINLTAIEQTLPASLFVWPDHRSFTGQPSVEIHTLGNPLLLEMVLQELVKVGAAIAQPGEFTYRAFLNGRIDLTQCEAILAVIHSNNERALDVSLRQLAGGLSEPLSQLRTVLIELLADLEAGLDFVDEDIQFISPSEIKARLRDAHSTLEQVTLQLGSRRATNLHPRVAIVGAPNAGKSSLINKLVDAQVAIVSDQSGTTRDFLKASLKTSHGELELLDTAGIESLPGDSDCKDDKDSIDGESILARSFAATFDAWTHADLVLFCFDPTTTQVPVQAAYEDFIRRSPARVNQAAEVWFIATKADLLTEQQTHRLVSEFPTYLLSSKTGVGIRELQTRLSDWLQEQQAKDHDVVPMTLVRCAESVVRARESIENALALSGVPIGQTANCMASTDGTSMSGDEVIAAEIRVALSELGRVVGEVYTDDILDALFSRFCIGK